MASASHASSPQRHRGSVAGPSGAGTRQSSPQRSGALAGTLDILSRWASIVTAPPIAQRQQDEEFWRTGPGAGVVRAETVGAPRSALSQSPGRRRGLSEASQVSFMLSASPATSAPPAAQRSKTIILPVRVEPKVQFANERTFLGWMNYVG